MTDLYIEGNHPDGVRAICKQCGTVALKDTESDAHDTVDRHNGWKHEGKDVAGVCAWDVEPLLTDDMPLAAKMAVQESLNRDLTHEEKRKALGLVE